MSLKSVQRFRDKDMRKIKKPTVCRVICFHATCCRSREPIGLTVGCPASTSHFDRDGTSRDRDACPPHAAQPLLPGADPGAAQLLGRLWLPYPAALRHGGRRRHLPSGHDAACAGAETLERGLCAAFPPAEGRPLWRKPQPAAALLPVPSDPEAEPAQPAGALSRLAEGDRHRSAA